MHMHMGAHRHIHIHVHIALWRAELKKKMMGNGMMMITCKRSEHGIPTCAKVTHPDMPEVTHK